MADATTRLVIGGAALTRLDDIALGETLTAFAASGGRWLDISPAYGGFRKMNLIGMAVRRWAPMLRPLIKLGYFADGLSYRDPAKLREQCARSVEEFGVAPAAIMLHEADWKTWWLETGAPAITLAAGDVIASGVAATLAGLGRDYDCKTGLSGNNAEALSVAMQACPTANIVMMAKQTDLLWSSGDRLAARLASEDRTVLLAAPFHQGWLLRLRDIHQVRPGLKPFAARLAEMLAHAGRTVQDIAIPFLNTLHPHAAVVVGAMHASEVQLARNGISTTVPRPLFDSICANRRPGAAMPGRPLMKSSDDLLEIQW